MTRSGRETAETASPARRRWRIVGRSVGVLYCFVWLLIGTAFGHLYWGNQDFHEFVNQHWLGTATGMLTLNPMADFAIDKQFPGRTSLNVLVLGSDHDYDNKAREVATTHGRSDSILVAHFDFARGTIQALTIPRDTAVRIPGRRGLHKINAAHEFGGPELTIATIRQAFGIPIDGYISIDVDGFVKVVDALGGIDLTVEKRLKYDDNWGNLHVNLYPGFQHLTGYQAMGYVRMRHSDSDEMRSKRQHNFLMALRQKIMSPSSFYLLPRVMNAVSQSLHFGGDMSRDKALAIANMARTLPQQNIVVTTLPSEEGRSYVTVDVDKATETIERMFFDGRPGSVTLDVPDHSVVDRLNGQIGEGRRKTRVTAENPPVATGADLGVEEQPVQPDTPPDTQTPPADAGTRAQEPPTPGGSHTRPGQTGSSQPAGDLSVEGTGR